MFLEVTASVTEPAPVKEEVKKEEKPASPDVCPKCKAGSSIILRKVPIPYGHEVTRKCERCGNIWTHKSKYGPGAWP